MEFVNIIVAIAIGALLGIGIVGMYIWFLYHKIKSRIDHLIDEVVREAEDNLIGLDIEVDKDTYFCYNSKDKQFVCQGNTVAEIREGFKKRFPDKTAYLAGGDPAVVEHFKMELLRLSTNENSPSV